MLTRIEIDGFKTFEKFALDLGSFTVILGSNASGKSNLFDAIRLISNLSTLDLRHGFRDLRGEVFELLRRHPEPVDRMTFAVEVLLQPQVEDHWGRRVELSHTRLRYEIEIERRRDERGLDRLNVIWEEARPIFAKQDKWIEAKKVSREFRHRFLRYSRRTKFLVTHREGGGEPRFEIRQDGKAGRPFPASAASATVLSTVTTAEFPHLFALREELRSWRFLQLDPAALRRPSPSYGVAEELEPDGKNLAYVLARIKAETGTSDQPRGELAEIAAELASVIPGIMDVEVMSDRAETRATQDVLEDGSNRQYRIDIAVRGGIPFSSRVISDGTLRVLALLTLLHDPLHRGLLLFEEPENGIHPARLKMLIERLRVKVTDPADPPESFNLLSQIIMNSHSPVVLSSLMSSSVGVDPTIVFADTVTLVQPSVQAYPTTRMRRVASSDQGDLYPPGSGVSTFEVDRYLATVNAAGV